MNRVEAVGQMVGGIAHNFNNILTAVTANLSLLQLDGSLSESCTERVSDAEMAANRGTEMIKHLLKYSGKSNLNLAPHSINSIIVELDRLTNAAFDARFQFTHDLDVTNPLGLVDLGAIEQAILNLYLNARDAMPDGGTIATRTRVIKNGDQTMIGIWISDDGPGMPKEIRSQIFEPFFTTKAGGVGTGLGLSISKRLLHEQNGTLEVADAEHGTSFAITVPSTQRVASKEVVVRKKPQRITEKKTVLLADDEESIRKTCSLILETYGFDTLIAVDGDDALDVLQTDHERIDLLLLDLTMPGKSGLEILKITQKLYPNLPVILSSGYLGGVSTEPAASCMKLPKPYSAAQLIETISEALLDDAGTYIRRDNTSGIGSHRGTANGLFKSSNAGK